MIARRRTTTEAGRAEIHEEALPRDERAIVLCVAGELDMATAPELRERIAAIAAAGVQRLLLDLSEVSFIDSVATAAILSARGRLGEEGRLAIVAAQPYVLLIFEAGGLDGVLDVFPTREEAEAHVLS